ncbi:MULTISPECIES: helix-turn-helix transcriptional regulator [Rhodobacterales]|jgi:AraC family transcriptional regulator|nr:MULTISPECIES: AraC family transcriptional regulator [Rhodobacterales]MBB4626848.1 AraC family transcriptional regulator [Paracoccus denitrificans]MCU7427669.1 AraC family transcriptional regulator [Paracoccus denitrificans]QAR24933.1 AraC family transcriptional regulator [Paracoccus denitrificans]UPV93892.1 AraC family transcriptional regulator [Paracoccus denitrificans]WQO34170.1 AraC family transcriptional regulator [Paracoccus denitrificans]
MGHAFREADGFIPVSKALRDTDLFHPTQGRQCRAVFLKLQDGVDLLYWAGRFQSGMELPLKDDSDRVSLSFTTNLKGTASRNFTDKPDDHLPVRCNTGSIEYCPGRSGIYRQKGSLENLTLMIDNDLFSQWVDDRDNELIHLAKHGGSSGGYLGGELSAVIHLINQELAFHDQTQPPRRHPLWYQAQALSVVGLFLECRTDLRVESVNPDLRRKLLRARDLLLADLSAAPSIPALAFEAGLSAPSLTRGFKKLFGTSPYKLFQRERMHAAHHRLSVGRASVTMVAADLGYVNLSHFSAAFRKQFGMLPNELHRKG